MMGIIAFPLWFFGIGMLSTIFQVDPSTDYSLLSVLVRFLKAFVGWFWVVAIMGLATRLPHSKYIKTRNVEADYDITIQESKDPHKPVFKDRIVAYTKEVQLPFYILLHLPVVIIGFYVVQWEVAALVKYIVISLSSLIVTLVLFDVGIRRTKVKTKITLYPLRDRDQSSFQTVEVTSPPCPVQLVWKYSPRGLSMR